MLLFGRQGGSRREPGPVLLLKRGPGADPPRDPRIFAFLHGKKHSPPLAAGWQAGRDRLVGFDYTILYYTILILILILILYYTIPVNPLTGVVTNRFTWLTWLTWLAWLT